jgi:DNA-binding transcriptional LysR family regulator
MKTLPPLTLLETLVEVRRSQNLEEAARRLGVTQPTISRQLAQLQGHFKFPLFALVGRSKKLTPDALALCDAVEQSFASLEGRFRGWEQAQGKVENLRLRVGGPAELLCRLLAKSPAQPSLHAFPSSSRDAIERVVAGELDLALGTEIEDRHDLVARRLLREDFRLVCGPKVPTPSPAKLKDFLRSQPMLCYRAELAPLAKLLENFGLRAEELSRGHEIADWRTLLALAAEGRGWLLAPEGLAASRPELRSIPLPTKAVTSSEIWLASRRELSALTWFRAWSKGLEI